jgi:subtilase family serine protease
MRYSRAMAVVSTATALGLGIAAEAATVAASPTTHLSGTVAPLSAKSPSVGSVPAGSRIDFEVQLSPSDPAGARAFAQAVSTPGSASYRRYLTPSQWEQRFSPTARQVSEVTAFLRSKSFKVGAVSADRLAVDASGTTAQVERAFGTSVSYHDVRGKRLRLADRNFSIPAGLAGIVTGVTGVSQTLAAPGLATDNPRPAAAPAAPNSAAIPQPPGFRAASPCGDYYGQKADTTQPPYGNGYTSPAPYAVCGYKPGQLRSAYSTPSGVDGSGQTVAVLDPYASPTLLHDAQTYAARNDPGHPMRASQFSEVLPSSFGDADLCGASGWLGEQTLDVEAVHAIAPGAHIVLWAPPAARARCSRACGRSSTGTSPRW